MKSAFFRLINISLGTIFVCSAILYSLHFVGLQTQFKKMDHPLLKTSTSENTYREFLQGSEQISSTYEIVDISLFSANELKRFVGNSLALREGEGGTYKIPKVTLRFDGENWITFDPNNPKQTASLEKFLKVYPVKDLAIEVHGTLLDPLKKLVAGLVDLGFDERVVVFSDRSKVLHRLRELAPRWLYVANESQKMRAKVMSTLFLETLASFDFDIVAIESNSKGLPKLPWRLLKEFQRRFKVVLLNRSDLDDEPISPGLGQVVEGYVLSR